MKLAKSLIVILLVSFSFVSRAQGIESYIKKSVGFMCEVAQTQKEMKIALEKAQTPKEKTKLTAKFEAKLKKIVKNAKHHSKKMGKKYKGADMDGTQQMFEKGIKNCDALQSKEAFANIYQWLPAPQLYKGGKPVGTH